MGLAASQGRYLSLTARMSDLVYEGQQISQQRLALANETKIIAEEYTDAMNNTKMQVTTQQGGTQELNYDIITSQDPFSGLCMRIVDLNGNVVVPGENVNENLKNDNERFLFDKNCKDPKYLQEMLESGEWLLEQVNPNKESGWDEVMWQGSSVISEVYDTSDDAAAESKYESAMATLQRQDKMLEMRLEQVQTQESAVEKEIESVKEIINKNIEDSFKTFA